MSIWVALLAPLFFFGQSIPFPGPGMPAATSCSLSYTTNLKVWYKSDTGTTCTGGCTSGNPVTVWADQSGNANDLTEVSTPANFESGQINGLPSLRFDGISSVYDFTTPFQLNSTTMFVVLKLASTTNKNALIGGAAGSYTYWFGNSTAEQAADVTVTAALGNGTASADLNWHQVNINIVAATSITYRLGSASDGSASFSTATSGNQTEVGLSGGNPYFSGDVAEIIIYDASLSGGNVSTVESYLNCRYGI